MNLNNKKYKTMKTLLKKMKALTMCTILLIGFLAVNGQNRMWFSIDQWDKNGDTSYVFTDTINITILRENDQISTNSVSKMIELFNTPRMLNPDDNKILINQYLSQVTGWSTASTTYAGYGNYDDAGLNINQENLHKLYFASQNYKNDSTGVDYESKRKELLIRLRHELYARTDAMMNDFNDSICVGLRLTDSAFVAGKLQNNHDESSGVAFLELSQGGIAWIVNWYTVCQATAKEEDKYY